MHEHRIGAASRIALSLAALGGTLWLGASVARAIVGFDIFVPGTIEFKAAQTEAMRLHTIWIYTLLGGLTGWSFVALVVGGLWSAIALRPRWKRRGWILMSGILLLVIIPGQIWMMLQDYALWQLYDISTGMPLAPFQEIITVFSQRVMVVAASVINGMTLLVAVTMVLLLTWQPLHNDGRQTTDEGRHES
ncbi:MAG: hypothetical protein EHM43_13250 [Ignavibacteriae bacterium]|nr:MAG: hypothetical protein EHM43_13250 [Ignavibacteriota bacterium]